MLRLSDSGKNFEDMYNRLDRIPACDRQMDGRTSLHGIVRAMHMRRPCTNGITKVICC